MGWLALAPKFKCPHLSLGRLMLCSERALLEGWSLVAGAWKRDEETLLPTLWWQGSITCITDHFSPDPTLPFLLIVSHSTFT